MESNNLQKPIPFLKHVARHILDKYGEDLSQLTIVFPNKRAALFLNEYLAEMTHHTIWCPTYITISELFQKHSRLTVADDIKLVCDLYKSYIACTESNETLDQFFSWGSVMLDDFNDIDHCMANAKGVFSNLSDIHSFDSVDYLSDNQVEVLKRFFKNFDENHTTYLKKKFLQLWNQFQNIYDDFNDRLRKQGLTYEGALARAVVEDEQADFGSNTYLFVGFNALHETERLLFQKLKDEGRAEFFWDYDRYYVGMEEPQQEAGDQVRKFKSLFPNSLDDSDDQLYDNLRHNKHITFIGSPTGNMQARYVGQWLQDKRRTEAGNRTAVVLCDESLLPTVVHSIPQDVEEVNITTGYPLQHTAAASLVALLIELTQYGRSGSQAYRQKPVLAVLRHPYAIHISPQVTELAENLVSQHLHHPTRQQLAIDEGLTLLFSDLNVNREGDTHSFDLNRNLNLWMLDLLKRVAIGMRQHPDTDPMAKEAVFRTYTLINRLQNLIDSGDLCVEPTTYQRLLKLALAATNIPFHGEPAVGLQVMGVLETRNLDFEHLIVLSCNEGNMPKGLDQPSFIPQSIRDAFGMTTIRQKVGIYAYYFLRMLQRVGDVTIVYGNAPDNKNTGEKSRFMIQLMVESGLHIDLKTLHVGQKPSIRDHLPIEKTQAVAERLGAIGKLSPTAINRYLRCPMQFFYSYMAGIKEPESDDEEIDNRKFGSIFHDCMQTIYDELTGTTATSDAPPFAGSGHPITKSQLEYVLKHDSFISRHLDAAIKENVFKWTKGKPDYDGLQLINKMVIKHYVTQLLNIDLQLAPFTLRGHEGDVFTTIDIVTSEGKRKVKVGGRIDRLDEVTDSSGRRTIRVIDYKTGGKTAGTMAGVDDVFDPQNVHKHSDYFLQAMLYAMIVRESAEVNPHGLPVSPALLFIQHSGGKDYNPVLAFGSKNTRREITDIAEHTPAFKEHLTKVVGEMLDPKVPFSPTTDKKVCASCPYVSFCGKNRR